jgi:hypothetical protein
MEANGRGISVQLVAPDQINLVYRQVDCAHTFTCLEEPGLVVIDFDLERAFHMAERGVGKHVSLAYDTEVTYDLGMSFAQFAIQVAAKNSVHNSGVVVHFPMSRHSGLSGPLTKVA